MSDRQRTGGGPSRRSVLRATVAATGAVGLAGCSIDASGDGFEVSFGGEGDGTPASTVSDPETSGTKTDTSTGTPTDYPDPAFEEDCLSVDPGDVEVEKYGDGDYRLVEGDSILLAFTEFDDAKRSRDVVQFYAFTQLCFVGRPDPPMQYWLVDGAPAVQGTEEAVEGEDCIPFDRSTLAVEKYGDGDWRLVTDSQIVLALSSEERARTALAVIEHYGFDTQCFVGRPDAPMQYWLSHPRD